MTTLNLTLPVPAILTNLTVTGGVDAFLEWDASAFVADQYEVWYSTTSNNFNDATLLATVETNFYHYRGTTAAPGSARYFWVRTVNSVGVRGPATSFPDATPTDYTVGTNFNTLKFGVYVQEVAAGSAAYSLQSVKMRVTYLSATTGLTVDTGLLPFTTTVTQQSVTGGIGNTAWTSPDNARVDDTNYATITMSIGNTSVSQYLLFTIADLAIPNTAKILGVEFQVKAKTTVALAGVFKGQFLASGVELGITSSTSTLTPVNTDLTLLNTDNLSVTPHFRFSLPYIGTGKKLTVSSVDAVSGFTVTPGVGSVKLQWTAGDILDTYEVYRGTVNRVFNATKLTTVTGTSYTDVGLTFGTTYYYWVRRLNYTQTPGAFTSVATATPIDYTIATNFNGQTRLFIYAVATGSCTISLDYLEVQVSYVTTDDGLVSVTVPYVGITPTNNASIGTVAWTNPSFATSLDSSYATVTLSAGQTSNYIGGVIASIPAGAHVVGIQFNAAGFVSALGNATVYCVAVNTVTGPQSGTLNVVPFTTLTNTYNGGSASSVIGLPFIGTGTTSALATVDTVLPSQTGNSGKYLTTNGTTSSWATAGGSSTPALTPLGARLLEEDFLVGSSLTSVATTNWTAGRFTVFGSASSVNQFVTGEDTHPGIVRIGTTGSGEFPAITLGNTLSQAMILPTDIDTMIAYVRPNGSSNNNMRIGFTTDFGTGTPANAIWFQSNGPGWIGACRSGGSATQTGSQTITYGNWYELKIVKNNSSSISFYINGTLLGTVTATVPTVAMNCGVRCSDAGSNTLDVDYIGLKTVTWTQRYT